jgi:hypothetical protein
MYHDSILAFLVFKALFILGAISIFSFVLKGISDFITRDLAVFVKDVIRTWHDLMSVLHSKPPR